MQATVSHNLKDPHFKSLEPNCLSPFACDYDTVSYEKGMNLCRLQLTTFGHVEEDTLPGLVDA